MSLPTLLLIANKGTAHELTISSDRLESGRTIFWLDNTPNHRAGQMWDELPRIYKTVRGCKLAAANLLGEPQKWEEPTPPQENDR